jgi:hypothetical protein
MNTYIESNGVVHTALTEEQVKELDNSIPEGGIILSRISDGEYGNNNFGNLFSSFSKALELAKKYDPIYEIIKVDRLKDTEYTLGFFSPSKYTDSKLIPYEYADLSIEFIDQPFIIW